MTRQNKGDVRKMKNCKDLISRYISVIGAGAVSVLVLNVIFLLFQNVIQLYLPAYMVEQVSGNTDIVRLAVLGITYFVVLMLATYFNGSHQKYLFRYRLKEIGNVYLSCFNIPVQNIERDNGKSEIEKALYAVANGNDIGLEAYLSALTQLITATLMFFIYLYMGRRLPLFAFAVFFLSVVLSIPLERRINREESEEL